MRILHIKNIFIFSIIVTLFILCLIHIPWSQDNVVSKRTISRVLHSYHGYQQNMRGLNTTIHSQLLFVLELLGRLPHLPEPHLLNRDHFLKDVEKQKPWHWLQRILLNKAFYTHEELKIFKYSIILLYTVVGVSYIIHQLLHNTLQFNLLKWLIIILCSLNVGP